MPRCLALIWNNRTNYPLSVGLKLPLNQIAEVFGINPNDILNFDENTIYNFENMHNSAPHGTVKNYTLSEDERNLFHDQITALSNLVDKQTKLIEILRKADKYVNHM